MRVGEDLLLVRHGRSHRTLPRWGRLNGKSIGRRGVALQRPTSTGAGTFSLFLSVASAIAADAKAYRRKPPKTKPVSPGLRSCTLVCRAWRRCQIPGAYTVESPYHEAQFEHSHVRDGAPSYCRELRRPRPRLRRRLAVPLPERRCAWGRRSRSGRAAGWFPRVASSAVGVSSFWILRRVRRSIDASCSRSSAPQSEMAVPLAPARPVRPTRWT